MEEEEKGEGKREEKEDSNRVRIEDGDDEYGLHSMERK